MRRGFPVLAALALAFCLLLALSAGESWIPPSGIWAALARFDETRQADVIVIYQRLPRALIAMLAGAALSMSGAVLQGVLRNPLASPSLVGINAGAALAVVAGAFGDISNMKPALVWLSCVESYSVLKHVQYNSTPRTASVCSRSIWVATRTDN